MFEVITERLRLRHLQEKDLDAFMAYRADPQVALYQSWEAADESRSLKFIKDQQTIAIGTDEEWNQIGIALNTSDTLIGDCGLRVHDRGRQAEYGITLAAEHQGQGYATEALTALFNYCFHELNLHRIYGIADIRNNGSIMLMERLGMRREAHTLQAYWNKGEWVDEVWYAVLKSEWRL